MIPFKFNKLYFLLTALLFVVEFLIGTYTHDSFIRPYVGDFFIVIFVYCFLKSFVKIPVNTAALLVLVIAFTAEGLQYINFLDIMGWRNSKLANILLGNWFAWEDFLAYSLGTIATIVAERVMAARETKILLFI